MLVAIFSAVNESVWEHLKLAIIPVYIVAIAKMWVQEERKKNLWTALFFKIMIISVLVPILLYSYKAIFKIEKVLIDIAIFYISIVFAETIEYLIQNKINISAKLEDIFKYLNIFIIGIYVLFTFMPPKIEMFKDNINNKYGI